MYLKLSYRRAVLSFPLGWPGVKTPLVLNKCCKHGNEKRVQCADDVCVYCVTEKEASDLVLQLHQLLASGGFQLTKFVFNSRTVLEQAPPYDTLGDVHPSEELPVHKTLSMLWDALSDQLRVGVSIKKRLCTRRGLLSMIGQTYDPLGGHPTFSVAC